jgi:hypothetical protein
MNLSVHTIRVTIPSDVDGDFRVKTQDLNTLLVSFGGKWDCSGRRPYNPDCDIDYNSYIAPIDLNILFVHYGQHCP